MSSRHFVCLPCRVAFKKPPDYARVRQDTCPRCGGELIDAGSALATPKRRNTAAWRALAAVLNAGIRFRQGCCGCGPGYRPRTPREVRERLALAGASGLPLRTALVCDDPSHHTDVTRRAGRGEYERRTPALAPARGPRQR